MEIVAGSGSNLFIVDVKELGNTENYWNMYRGNAQRSGFYVSILGCTDPEASNYDPDATNDNGSCTDMSYDQSINLSNGWNIISFNMTPDNMDMESILSVLMDEGSLVKVQNEGGDAIEYVSFLDLWTNNIGDMSVTEGYYVKVNTATVLSALGTPVGLPLDIALTNGWNIISYPAQNSQDALGALQGLMDEGSLVKVQNEAGDAIEYVSFLDLWTNNIGNLDPGEGYYLKVNQATTLTIDEGSAPARISSTEEKIDPVHFQPDYIGNPYLAMNLYIVDARINSNPAAYGTEIGIYDNGVCVGSAVVTQSLAPESSYLSLPVSKDDPTTEIIDGYIPGSKITVSIWDGEREYVADVGGLVFETQGTEFMNLDINTSPKSYKLYANYPNPFNPTTTISFALPLEAEVSLTVYNLQGREVISLIDGNMEAGYHSVVWNADSHASGMYFVKMQVETFQEIRKVLLIK